MMCSFLKIKCGYKAFCRSAFHASICHVIDVAAMGNRALCSHGRQQSFHMHLTSNCVEIWHPLVVYRNIGLHVAVSSGLVAKVKLILQLPLDTRQIVSNSRLLLSKGGKYRRQPGEVFAYVAGLTTCLHRQVL